MSNDTRTTNRTSSSVDTSTGERQDRDRSVARWRLVLTVWLEAVVVFGVLMLTSRLVTSDFFNWVAFGEAETPLGFTDAAVDYQRFIFAIAAAVMIGWMLALLIVVRGPMSDPRWSDRCWWAVAGSIGAWWAIDSSMSVALDFGRNAVLNTVFVLGAVPALVALRPRR